MVDRVVAKTASGHLITLEKEDLLAYPMELAPGEEQVVVLRLPKALSVDEIAQILVTLNNSRVTIALDPVYPQPASRTSTAQHP